MKILIDELISTKELSLKRKHKETPSEVLNKIFKLSTFDELLKTKVDADERNYYYAYRVLLSPTL